MSITKLKSDYVDGIVRDKRKYEIIENSDDTVTLNDVSDFIREELNIGATILNGVNSTINQVIDLAEANADDVDDIEDDLTDIISGDTKIGRVASADYATSVTTANTATNADSTPYATTATNADSVTNATNASEAVSATSADEADTATTATSADEAGTATNDFVLSRQTLNFNNRVCTIYDNRITASSIAEVYYTEETEETAKQADITAETDNIRVTLTATNNPTGTIVASIRIRVV